METQDTPLPEVSLALLQTAEARFPNEVAPAELPEYEKNARAGEQRVVAWLRDVYAKLNEKEEEDDDLPF